MNEKKIILNEISRIRNMMGLLNESKPKQIILEAVLSGGIVDDLIGLFIKKSADDLTALGVKNADDMITLARNYPTASVTDQADILKTIFKNVDEIALQNIGKSMIDDATSTIGRQVNGYVDNIKTMSDTYPNLSPGDLVAEFNKVIDDAFKGAADEVSGVIKGFKEEGAQRINAHKGSKTTGPTNVGPDPELLKLQDELSKAKGVEELINSFKNRTDWGKLSYRQRNQFEKFIRENSGKTVAEVGQAAEKEFITKITQAGLNATKKKALISKFTNLPWYGQVTLLLVISGVAGFPIASWLGWFAGKGIQAVDIEDMKKGFEEGMKEEEPKKEENPNNPVGGCPGESGFVDAIKAVYTGADGMPAYDAAKMSFDATKCTGTYDGTNYKWENNQWI